MELKTKTTIVTIVAYNYLAQALTLKESLGSIGIRFVIVLVEPLGSCDLPSQLEIYYAEQILGDRFKKLSFMYSIIELCTNIKPAVLRYFLSESDYVYYVDPDMYFYQSPDIINSEFGSHDVIITPHSLSPILDGANPSELEFMRAGVYNLGFIGLKKSKNSADFLEWWASRCEFYGLNETSSGLFVDQKFIDIAVAFYPFIGILRNYGVNVGYWNLHERIISAESDCIFVNSDRLVLFHFSGLDPLQPELISKHQNRYALSDRPDLKQIFLSYSEKLMEFRSNLVKSEIPFSRFNNGNVITDYARRFFWKYSLNYTDDDIFSESSRLYSDLSAASLINNRIKDLPSTIGSQTDFSKYSIQIRVLDIFIDFILKILGPVRLWNLLRFMRQRFSPISKIYYW